MPSSQGNLPRKLCAIHARQIDRARPITFFISRMPPDFNRLYQAFIEDRGVFSHGTPFAVETGGAFNPFIHHQGKQIA
jgi:hypothetical protein